MSPASTTDPTQTTFWDRLISPIQGLVNLDATAVASALGLWFSVKAAIQTVASGVAEIVATAPLQQVQKQFLDVPLTALQLADGAVRNILQYPGTAASAPRMGSVGGNDVYAEAALTGVSQDRMNFLLYEAGESYGILDALRLYNRGLSMYGLDPISGSSLATPIYTQGASLKTVYGIDQQQLLQVLYYSRVRPEFYDDLMKLHANTLSPADAVELAVKEIVDMQTAQNLFIAGGGVAEQFGALVRAAGDAAGLEHAVSLAQHKVITEEHLQQIIAMSRLNPAFYYLYELDPASGQAMMGIKWLSPYEISEAMKAGTVSATTAQQWLVESGYDVAQAAAFTTALSGGAVTSAKHETEGQVVSAYMAKQITEAQATTELKNLGYSATAIPFVLQSATARQVTADMDKTIARVRMSFLFGEISGAQAQTALSQIGVAAPAISAYLTDWTAELNVPHVHLTEAIIGRLYKEGTIPETVAQAKWKSMGYPSDEVGYLLQYYKPA